MPPIVHIQHSTSLYFSQHAICLLSMTSNLRTLGAQNLEFDTLSALSSIQSWLHQLWLSPKRIFSFSVIRIWHVLSFTISRKSLCVLQILGILAHQLHFILPNSAFLKPMPISLRRDLLVTLRSSSVSRNLIHKWPCLRIRRLIRFICLTLCP